MRNNTALCTLRPAPHVLATVRLRANKHLLRVPIISLYLPTAIVLLKGQLADRQSLGHRVLLRCPQETWLLTVGMTRLHDASFPVQGILRVDASHKGSSLVHQPQFNEAAHAMRANPVLPRC